MYQRFFTVLLVAVLTLVFVERAHAGDFTFVCVRDVPARLPSCPTGCEVRLYQIAPRFIRDSKHKPGWHEFLFSNGLFFPKGGFVVYQPSTGVCLIASTADDLDLISPLR